MSKSNSPRCAKATAVGIVMSALVLLCLTETAATQDAAYDVVLQLGHSRPVTTIALTTDGRFALSGSEDKSVKLWDVGSGRELRTFRGHTGTVRSVAVSVDGRTALSGSTDKSMRLWDVASGKELRLFGAHAGDVNSVALSRDGRIAASAGADKLVKLWDIATGQEIRTLRAHTDHVQSVAFSPDGRSLASGSDDGTIRLWDATTGRELRILQGGLIVSITFSADGRAILSGSRPNALTDVPSRVTLWDVQSGRELKAFTGHSSAIRSVAFSPDGKRAISASADSTVKLWDVESGSELKTLTGHFESVNAVAMSPDGRTALSGGSDNGIKVWDTTTGAEARTLRGRSAPVRSVAVSSDGSKILIGTANNRVKLWSAVSGRELRQFREYSDNVGPLAYSLDVHVTSVGFSPDGRTALSASFDKTLKLWDVDTGRLSKTLGGHSERIHSATLSPDGRTAVSASLDTTVRLWDVSTGKQIRLLKPGGGGTSIKAAAFTTIGLVSGDDEGTLRFSSTENGRNVKTVEKAHPHAISALTSSPDGRLVLSGDGDGGLKLWDVASGRLRKALPGHAYEVTSVAFSRDGRTALSAGGDDLIKIWDISSGREIRTIVGHSDDVTSVAFSTDSRAIVSGSTDTTVRIWDSLTGAERVRIVAFLDGSWLTITPEGFFDASSPEAAKNLSIVRGLDGYLVDQVYQALYRPDLVQEKLAGDPSGHVRAAASKMNLTIAVQSGSPPMVRIASPQSLSPTVATMQIEADIDQRDGGIGRIEWRLNDVVRGVQSPPASTETTVRLAQELTLSDGENRIEVVAYNRQNLIASQPATINIKFKPQNVVHAPRLFALGVGINDYYDSRLQLRYAVPDAKAIIAAIGGARGEMYAEVDTRLLMDSDVTPEKLNRAFTEIGAKMRPQDVFILFMAGHGKTIDGTYYYLPRNFRYDGDESVVKTGIGQNTLQSWLARIPAQRSLLLFDTCESGSMLGERLQRRDMERLVAVEKMTRTMGRTTIAASTDDTPALEGYRGHGVFTYSLLRAFGEADANGDGRVDVTELIGFVDRIVPELSYDAFKFRQIPQAKFVGSNFQLMAKAAVLPDAPASAIPTKPTHVVVAAAEVFSEIGGRPSQTLKPGSLVAIMRTQSGWSLIARDGRQLGYVREATIARLQ